MKRCVVLLLVAACAPPAFAVPKASRVAAPSRWSTMSWEDRHDTMTFLVLPEMARAFQRFEGKPYPDLTCFSCHGEEAEKIEYRMPNGPPLDPAHLPRKDSPDPHEAKLAAFMMDDVTTRAAEMLGKPDVGCFTCHMAKAAP